MSDLHKSDPDSPYADDMDFVRDYARRNDGYPLVQPVVDFINAHQDPQIIRTVEELQAEDPDTVLWSQYEAYISASALLEDIAWDTEYEGDLPAVVIRDGAEVRAARRALEEA